MKQTTSGRHILSLIPHSAILCAYVFIFPSVPLPFRGQSSYPKSSMSLAILLWAQESHLWNLKLHHPILSPAAYGPSRAIWSWGICYPKIIGPSSLMVPSFPLIFQSPADHSSFTSLDLKTLTNGSFNTHILVCLWLILHPPSWVPGCCLEHRGSTTDSWFAIVIEASAQVSPFAFLCSVSSTIYYKKNFNRLPLSWRHVTPIDLSGGSNHSDPSLLVKLAFIGFYDVSVALLSSLLGH